MPIRTHGWFTLDTRPKSADGLRAEMPSCCDRAPISLVFAVACSRDAAGGCHGTLKRQSAVSPIRFLRPSKSRRVRLVGRAVLNVRNLSTTFQVARFDDREQATKNAPLSLSSVLVSGANPKPQPPFTAVQYIDHMWLTAGP
ncbi:hypothetical protein VTK56DRAFT_6084 [Thermocarpiscus australiensis]